MARLTVLKDAVEKIKRVLMMKRPQASHPQPPQFSSTQLNSAQLSSQLKQGSLVVEGFQRQGGMVPQHMPALQQHIQHTVSRTLNTHPASCLVSTLK
jgi:hypothetical protein